MSPGVDGRLGDTRNVGRTTAGGAPLTTAAGGETRPVGTPSTSAPAVSAADARAAKKEASRLERRLEKLGAEEERLHGQLAAAATDHARVLELDERLRAVLAEKDQVETDWLAAAEVAEG